MSSMPCVFFMSCVGFFSCHVLGFFHVMCWVFSMSCLCPVCLLVCVLGVVFMPSFESCASRSDLAVCPVSDHNVLLSPVQCLHVLL